MLPAERRKLILTLVESRRSVSVSELCQALDVSEMTIRRDLRLLSERGLVERVHGGAVLRQQHAAEPFQKPGYSTNDHRSAAVARKAASLVHEGCSLSLDVGPITFELARSVVGIPELTVVTAGLHITNVLTQASNIRVIVSGGVIQPGSMGMTGHIAMQAFRTFRVDKAFIEVEGLSTTHGITGSSHEDVLIKQAILEHAKQIVVLADSSQLGVSRLISIAPLEAIDILVTDWGAPAEMVSEFEGRGVTVLIAEPEAAS
ncbi:MAG: DeoR/GlpR family DNA-binding transcription regulator [Anaerolineae bacterium]